MRKFKDFIIEATVLIPSELKRYEDRMALYIKKINKGESFELTTGKSVKIQRSAQLIRSLKAGDLKGVALTTTSGDPVAWSTLKKTDEFGGKGAGSSTAVEDGQLKALNRQIKAAGAPISIKVGGKTFKILKAETTFGTPKSDFHLVDVNGKPVVWISHKKGKGPRDFNQWGGVTNPALKDHPEILKFVKDMQKKFGKKIPNKTNARRKIKDKKLRMKA